MKWVKHRMGVQKWFFFEVLKNEEKKRQNKIFNKQSEDLEEPEARRTRRA
jgi:hypothetical protein